MLSRRMKYTYQVISKCQATHPYHLCIDENGKYYENRDIKLNFSIKDILKLISKTKMKNCWSTIDQGLHCV